MADFRVFGRIERLGNKFIVIVSTLTDERPHKAGDVDLYVADTLEEAEQERERRMRSSGEAIRKRGDRVTDVEVDLIKKAPRNPVMRLGMRLFQNPTEGSLLISRNVAFGAAAACLVIVSQIIQVGAKDAALEIATVAACISIPLWLGVGFAFETYITIGPRSYAHLRTPRLYDRFQHLWTAAGLTTFISVGAVAYYLSSNALIGLVLASIVALIGLTAICGNVASWWYSNDGPGEKDGPFD